jgi:hypothetical protein
MMPLFHANIGKRLAKSPDDPQMPSTDFPISSSMEMDQHLFKMGQPDIHKGIIPSRVFHNAVRKEVDQMT